jgi:hypothetical protein
VADYVGERLLDDAIDGRVEGFGQRTLVALDLQLHVHSGALHGLPEPTQGERAAAVAPAAPGARRRLSAGTSRIRPISAGPGRPLSTIASAEILEAAPDGIPSASTRG